MIELDDPLNLPVYAFLTAGLLPHEREWPRFHNRWRDVMEVGIQELNTHPDLGYRLRDVKPDGATWGILACRFALRAGNGVLFALAIGTHEMYFRAGSSPLVAVAGGDPEPSLGADWAKVNAWMSPFSAKEMLHLHRDLAADAQRHALALAP